jgi:hypothetical protein
LSHIALSTLNPWPLVMYEDQTEGNGHSFLLDQTWPWRHCLTGLRASCLWIQLSTAPDQTDEKHSLKSICRIAYCGYQ